MEGNSVKINFESFRSTLMERGKRIQGRIDNLRGVFGSNAYSCNHRQDEEKTLTELSLSMI